MLTEPKHEVLVTSSPIVFYKTEDEYPNDMQVEETRPTRSILEIVPPPDLTLALPPSQSGPANLKSNAKRLP